MAKRFQNIILVSVSTLGSRVLGLLRDMLTMSFLGLSMASSAFLFAFTVPNLFRRLLGEGALTSAFIPVLAEKVQREGRESALVFVNQIVSWAFLALALVILVGAACYGTLAWAMESGMGADWDPEMREQWRSGAWMGLFLIPYMLLVCLAALLGAVLNVLQRFAIHALSAVWLNMAMILALVVGGWWLGLPPLQLSYLLCLGVFVGGVFQLTIPFVALWGEGWRPRPDFQRNGAVNEVFLLFLPGVAGAAIMQINILVSRVLAFSLNTEATAALYLANRLVELPLGLFTIAIATVIFPQLSLLAAAKDEKGLCGTYGQGLRMILAITVPASIGLILLSEPILGFFFQWGRFTAMDVMATRPLLIIYAIAIPFYSLSTYVTRGFHSLKDTRTPVRVAGWNFCINLVCSLVFMQLWGTPGLAAANLLAAIYQSFHLQWLLIRKKPVFSDVSLRAALIRILSAGAVMGLVTWGGWFVIHSALGEGKTAFLLAILVLIPLGVLVYFACLWALRFEERREVGDLLLRLLRRKSPSR